MFRLFIHCNQPPSLAHEDILETVALTRSQVQCSHSISATGDFQVYDKIQAWKMLVIRLSLVKPKSFGETKHKVGTYSTCSEFHLSS